MLNHAQNQNALVKTLYNKTNISYQLSSMTILLTMTKKCQSGEENPKKKQQSVNINNNFHTPQGNGKSYHNPLFEKRLKSINIRGIPQDANKSSAEDQPIN